MSPYRVASPDSSSDAHGEADDMSYGAPQQYLEHEVMAQRAADSANAAQMEQDLEDSLRRFLGESEAGSSQSSSGAQHVEAAIHGPDRAAGNDMGNDHGERQYLDSSLINASRTQPAAQRMYNEGRPGFTPNAYAAQPARYHAPATTPATMVAPMPTASPTAAFAYTPRGRRPTPAAISGPSSARNAMLSPMAGLAYGPNGHTSYTSGGRGSYGASGQASDWIQDQASYGANGHPARRSSDHHSYDNQYLASQPCRREENLQGHEVDLQAREERLQAQTESLQAQTENLKRWELHISDMKRVKETKIREICEGLEVREGKVKKREKAVVRREKRLVNTCLICRNAYKSMNKQVDALDAIIAEQDADQAAEKEAMMQ